MRTGRSRHKCYMNRILITGANGLLGSATAKRFVEAGFEVLALCRAESDTSSLKDIAAKITIVEGDILDILSLEKALDKNRELFRATWTDDAKRKAFWDKRNKYDDGRHSDYIYKLVHELTK